LSTVQQQRELLVKSERPEERATPTRHGTGEIKERETEGES
jgi:hypothetical protein